MGGKRDPTNSDHKTLRCDWCIQDTLKDDDFFFIISFGHGAPPIAPVLSEEKL